MSDRTPWWKGPRARLYALVAVLWLIVLAVAIAAHRVLLPFQIALLLAYVINPVVSGLARRRPFGVPVPRWAAVLVVYTFIGFLLWFASIAVLPQIYGEAMRGLADLRETLAGMGPEKFRAWAHQAQQLMVRWGVPLELLPGGMGAAPHVSVDLVAVLADAMEEATTWIRGNIADVLGFSRAILAGAVRAIFFLVLLLMITAFVLVDSPRILAWSETLVPRTWRGDWRRLLAMLDQGLAGVVRGQLTICLINGVLTLAGLLILKIPFPFALAALATVLYLVPIFGTIISTLPIVLLGLSAGGLKMGLAALIWVLVIHALESYVLNPKIMGDASKIHPVLIVLALVIGEYHYGLVGALLAVPAASVIASVFKFVRLKAMEEEARLSPPPVAPPTPPAAVPPPP